MNIAKNMEALFVIAVALAGVTSLATAAVPTLAVPQLHAAPTPQMSAPSVAPDAMQTVVIVGKRLSPAEKAAR